MSTWNFSGPFFSLDSVKFLFLPCLCSVNELFFLDFLFFKTGCMLLKHSEHQRNIVYLLWLYSVKLTVKKCAGESLRGGSILPGDVLVDYNGPTPPKGTGSYHSKFWYRYVLAAVLGMQCIISTGNKGIVSSLFCNALQLSLFIFEIVAFCKGLQCNGWRPICVTNIVTHKNDMDQHSCIVPRWSNSKFLNVQKITFHFLHFSEIFEFAF
jgi:hypothetical protein